MASYDSPYQIGGSLQLNSPTYVTRRADRELYEGLSAGDFCYVLNCRQMGKSSLRVQTMARLQAAGVACVAVQMTDIIDEEITPEQFYAGVIDSITQDLELDFDNMAWWEANAGLSLVNRFSKFLEGVLLQRLAGDVVIFIDEIDRVLSLPFRVNGFFAAIRECYNKRADNPIYRRLTFSLLGVATPSDLIEDKRSTPFNIGRAIELHGFTRSEAQPLAQGLRVAHPDETLAAILDWTGGQPFLTQKVCRLVADQAEDAVAEGAVADWVDGLVRSRVIHNWAANDEPEHLRTIRDRLLRDEHRAARRLGLYQQILAQDGLPTSRANVEHIELRLTGLVVEQAGRLQIYNAIYAAIFSAEWAVRKLADLRPYTKAIDAWLASGRMDKWHLLQGGALAKAKQWSEDKVLPPEDYAFLAASQELVTEETEEARQTLARANRTLEEANREATVRMNSANRRLRIGSGILMGTIALFAFTGGYANQQIGKAEEKSEQALTDAKEANEASSKLQDETEQARLGAEVAQQNVRKAEEKGKRIEEKGKKIKQESQRRSKAARAEVEQAAVQARQAQAQAQQALDATQQAEQKQGLVQKKADEAQSQANYAQILARSAQQKATQAQQDVATAQKKQEIIAAGVSLERSATELWRNPNSDIRGLDTLIKVLTIAQNLKLLLNFADQGKTVDFASDYPEISRSLRTSLNSALGTTQFKGGYPSFSKDGQQLVTSSYETSWLYNLSGQQLAEFKGGNPSFSENGQQLATSSDTKDTSWLYNLSGQQLAEFKGSFPSFSNDGQRLATFSETKDTAWLYDLSGKQLAEFEGSFPSFSEDGQRLVTSLYQEDTSRLYDLSGQQLAEFKGIEPSFSEDGQRLVTSLYQEDTSRLYDLSGQQLAEFKGIEPSFSEDGQRLVTSSYQEDTSWLYDLSGQQLAEFKGIEPSFSEDGQRLVTSSYQEDTSWLYDLSGQQLAEFKGIKPSFSKNGQRLVTFSYQEDTSRLYDLTGKQIAEFKGSHPSFSEDGQRLAISQEDTSQVYSLFGKNIFARIQASEAYIISVGKNEQRLVTSSREEDTARLYDFSGQQLAEFKGSHPRFSEEAQRLVTEYSRDKSRLYDLSGQLISELKGSLPHFSKDGQRLATFSFQDFRLYDISGQLVAEVKGDYDGFSVDEQWLITFSRKEGVSRFYDFSGKLILESESSFPSFSENGQWLVTHSEEENTSRLYSLSGQLIVELKGSHASFSKDGQRLVTSSFKEDTSWLYDLSGKQLAEFKGTKPSFSKDGQRLVTSSFKEDTSWLYDLSGKQLAEFEGRFHGFSKDGRRLVTDVADQDISRIYNTAGTLLAEFSGSVSNPMDPMEQLGFTPDDKHLFTRTNDGDYHLWQLDNGLEDLLARGCDWVRPYLQANPEETRAAFCKEDPG